MRLVLILISVGLAAASLAAALAPSKHCVRHTKAMPIAAGVGAVGSLILLLLSKSNDIVGFGIAGAFLLLSAILCLEYLTWHIDSVFLEDHFTVKSFFRSAEVKKADVAGFTERKNGGVLHLKNGRRILADSVVDLDVLVEDIESYQAELLGQKFYFLPDYPEQLFHGYLKNPNDFVFLFVLLLLFFAGAAAAPFVAMRENINLGEKDCVWVEVLKPSAAFSEQGNVELPREEDSAYVCRNLKQVFEERQIQSVVQTINRAKTVELAIPAAELDDHTASRKYYSVRAILCEQEMIVSFEQTSAGLKGEAQKISLVMLIFLGAYLVFVCSFCIIVSNAPRYYKILRLFVKEEWLNL